MASTNKLPSSDLNQWLETDKPEMEDFNRDNRIIDGLVGHLKKTPYIGANGNWFVWDTDAGEYVDTEKKSRGELGPRGVQGVQGERGVQGETGPQGMKGDRGETGETGPQGQKGDQGERGETGAGFQLKGLYATLEALQAAHPTGVAGDAYAVGTSAANVVYLWSDEGWVNVGELQGPQGERGEIGPQGAKGDPGEPGATGPKGDQGEPGVKGDKGDKGEQGERGLQGAPAKVNGVAPDEAGNITMTAADIGADPAGSAAAVQAALDASKVNKSTAYHLTFAAAGWTGTPASQTLSIPKGTETSVNELYEAKEITTEQLAALRAADLADGGQAAGTATFTVRGEVPTIDIPVMVIVREDL